MMNESKIEAILNKNDRLIRTAGAFLLEIDEDQLFITDSCEGVDMVPLTKDMCQKLSALFKDLGDQL